MTNEDFLRGIRKYVADQQITVAEFARRVNRPYPTVQDWVQNGLRSEYGRRRVAVSYPWLFSSENSQMKQVLENSSSVSENHKPKQLESQDCSRNSFLSTVKIEMSRHYVLSFTELLRWFVFQATEKERNEFRDELGDGWRDFLSLTRAMTGETALRVTREQGGLTKWEQQQ